MEGVHFGLSGFLVSRLLCFRVSDGSNVVVWRGGLEPSIRPGGINFFPLLISASVCDFRLCPPGRHRTLEGIQCFFKNATLKMSQVERQSRLQRLSPLSTAACDLIGCQARQFPHSSPETDFTTSRRPHVFPHFHGHINPKLKKRNPNTAENHTPTRFPHCYFIDNCHYPGHDIGQRIARVSIASQLLRIGSIRIVS